MLMESKRFWHIIWMVIYVLVLPDVRGTISYDPNSLDSFLHDYASKKMVKPRTGTLYNISLPSNFSGIDLSVIRMRSKSLWTGGVNLSFFNIPQRTLPWPFTKRIDIVYQNLGNWSSYYYNVPNHTLIAPVIGLIAYDSNRSSAADNDSLVLLGIMGADPIQVHFPQISLPGEKNPTMKCVRFNINGGVEFSNMIFKTNTCIAKGQGHFSVVIPSPSPSPPPSKKKEKRRPWKWWAIGFGVGIVGLILLMGLIIFVYKLVRVNRIGKMEKESERSEGLDTIWIGRSRMPTAPGIRTQPVLENSYVP